MAAAKSLDILKGAILLERRGKALYDSVLKASESESVKELFNILSREEDKHIDVLTKQFSRITKGKSFDIGELEKEHATTYEAIITDEIVKGISAAGYEAAVIAAALEFEKNAVKFYSEHAASADLRTGGQSGAHRPAPGSRSLDPGRFQRSHHWPRRGPHEAGLSRPEPAQSVQSQYHH